MMKTEKTNPCIRIESTVEYDQDIVYGLLNNLDIMGWYPECGRVADIVLAIGGDAAVLKAAKVGIPILAWNQGTLGFLTTGSNLELLLKAYLCDSLHVEHRRKLFIFANNKAYSALNEVTIVGKETGRLVETDLYIDKKRITTYKGDGLIVSTPTGSTAWSLSAGGSLVEYGVSCMLITPMNPFTMNVRPLIIDSNHIVTLEKVEKFVIDGHDMVSPDNGRVDVRYDTEVVTIYRQQEENFFEAIIEKLHWNQSIKGQ